MAARRHDVGEGWPHSQQALKDAGEPGAVLQSLAKVALQWVPLRGTHEHCMQLTSAQGASSEPRHPQVPLSEHSHPATQQPLESLVLWGNLRCLKTDITKAGPMTLVQGSRAYSHQTPRGPPQLPQQCTWLFTCRAYTGQEVILGARRPPKRISPQSCARRGENKGKALQGVSGPVLKDTLNPLPAHSSRGHTEVWAAVTCPRSHRW